MAGVGVRRLVVGVAIERDGRWLVARRTRPPALAGRWEFPGGKVEPGESPTQAAVREIGEELGVRIEVTGEVPAPDGTWPIDDVLHMAVLTATAVGEPAPRDAHDAIRWVAPGQFDDVEWVPADIEVARALARRGQ